VDCGIGLCCGRVFVFVCATAVARNMVAMVRNTIRRVNVDTFLIDVPPPEKTAATGGGVRLSF